MSIYKLIPVITFHSDSSQSIEHMLVAAQKKTTHIVTHTTATYMCSHLHPADTCWVQSRLIIFEPWLSAPGISKILNRKPEFQAMVS